MNTNLTAPRPAMRKLLKKYGFVPDKLVTDELRSYAAAARHLGIAKRHERGRWLIWLGDLDSNHD
jgi:putative transposase